MRIKFAVLGVFISSLLFAFAAPSSAFADTLTLTGTVKNSSGQAIENATVSVNNTNNDSTTTNSEGFYTLSFEGGTYNVTATPPSGNQFSETVALSQNITSNTILNFVLAPAGTVILKGHLYNHEGTPLPNQFIGILDPVSNSYIGTANTATDGTYSIQVTAGTYTLRITGDNGAGTLQAPGAYSIGKTNYSLNQSKLLDIYLPTKKINVHVENQLSQAIQYAKISTQSTPLQISNLPLGGDITNAEGYSNYYTGDNTNQITDEYGKASIYLFPKTTGTLYSIIATPPAGSNLSSVTISNYGFSTDKNLTITLSQPVTFSGHLYNKLGEPLQNQFVGLLNETTRAYAGTATTDQNGVYTMQVTPGNYTLRIQGNSNPASYNAPTNYSFAVLNFDVTQNRTEELTLPTKQVTVHVQDVAGTSISDIAVSTQTSPQGAGNLALNANITNAEGYTAYPPGGNLNPLTNQSGNAILWLIPKTTGTLYSIIATPPSGSQYSSVTKSNFGFSNDISTTIELKQPVTFNGHIYDQDQNPLPGQNIGLVDPVTSQYVGQVTTENDGSFSMQITSGTYKLIITGGNNVATLNVPGSYSLSKENFTISQNTTENITLPTKKVSIHVQDVFNSPISNIGLSTQSSPPLATNLTLSPNITGVEGYSAYYPGDNTNPRTNEFGNTALWLFPKSTGSLYTLVAHPPSGSIYSAFSVADISVVNNQNELISLQYNHARPVTTISLATQNQDETYTNPTTVTLLATAADGYTVANTYYKVDNGEQQTYTEPFTVSGNTDHVITYWSVDNSGVQEAHKTKAFTINATYNLSGVVYVDANQNSVKDPEEAGYEGAVLTLDTNQTITTDITGGYSFTDLPAGTYIETLSAIPGYTITTTNPASVPLNADTTQNFAIVANPTPTPSGNPKFTASNVVISSSHISFDISNIDPNYTDTHNTFFAIEIRKPDYSQRYFYAAALPENGYVPNALSRQASCNALLRCDVDMTSDNNGTPTDYIIQISSDTLNHGNDALESQVLTWPTPTVVSSINTGGNTEGSYVADTNYSGGSVYTTSTAVDTSGVTNPAPEAVYQSVRYGNFSYTIPNLTPNAAYSLRLHFNELYWNTAGARVFNVSANGQQVLANYDIYQAAGGKDKAVVAQVPATADTNGEVTLQFATVTDNAMVNGVEVYTGELPSPTPTPPNPLNVNAGGANVESYSADNGFTGGSVYTTANSVATSGVTNPAPDAVYKSVRYGNFTYAMANLTPNTNYLVRLHFNELYWNSAGQRVFNVAINGNQVLGNYDIFQEAGGANTAVVEEFVKKADAAGTITISFANVVDNAAVSGIELQDASALPTYTLSGTVYNDANENGFQDSGEEGLSDVTVAVPGEGSITTDGNGDYTFSNFVAGVYTAQVTVPNGYIATTQNPVSLAITANTTQNFGVKQNNYAVDAGGNGASAFLADQHYTGGSVYTTTNSVDTTGVTSPAPVAVYQTVRYGNFSYTIPNLTPNSTHTVRLHFNELYWNTAGSRVFNISLNGTQVIENYDIYTAAGGANKAVVEDIQGTADANGTFTIQFTSVTDNAMVSGIELLN